MLVALAVLGALAASIRLAGKRPKDFGIDEVEIGLRAPADEVFATWDFSIYWFPTNDARTNALKKSITRFKGGICGWYRKTVTVR